MRPVEGPAPPEAVDLLPLDGAKARRFTEAYAPLIAAQAARFRLPHDLCQDVVQETLIRALRGLPSFRGDAKLSTWVYRIAWRECARAAERLKRQRSRQVAAPEHWEPAAREEADAAERADELARVRAAMAELPDEQRLALGYHYLDGQSVAEIAELMGAAPNTVKSWLKRGRDRIRSRMGEDTA